MSGGDGAPGWTFESVGLDFTKFHAADAAHVMQYKYDYAKGGRQEDRYPQMTWSQNYQLPANAIMWTLFFGGRTFAAKMQIDGRNVEDYLQGHYLGAMREIAIRVADQPHVLGFDTLNEPGMGWIGLPLGQGEQNPDPVRAGMLVSPLDGMLRRARANAHGAGSRLRQGDEEIRRNAQSAAQQESRFDLA